MTTYGQDRQFSVKEARQGVAVDGQHFYVVNNSDIAKYQKKNADLAGNWRDTTDAIKHLNSGIIIDGKLYCTHSNYPDEPMASSIEVFDPEMLEPIESISLGIHIGSATWVDFHNGHWYVAFAHYTGRGSELEKDNSWTQLVQFDSDWRRARGWVFPKKIIEKFGTRSNSGGFIAEDGTIYATGHDAKELYELNFPKMGPTLIWKHTYNVPFEGQGIALDEESEEHLTVWGIIKKENKIIQTTIKKQYP